MPREDVKRVSRVASYYHLPCSVSEEQAVCDDSRSEKGFNI